MRMFIFEASNMFERRLGRKPVLPLILNAGSWIAKPSLPLTYVSPNGKRGKGLALGRLSAVSSKLASFSP